VPGAGSSATTVRAVREAESETSGSVEVLLDHHLVGTGQAVVPRVVNRIVAVEGHDHALAAGQAVLLDDVRAPKCSRAAETSEGEAHTRLAAVGTPAAAMTSLANAFGALELGSRRARAEASDSPAPDESAAPATSGASGPTTTRSTPIRAASSAIASGSVTSTG